MPLISQRMAGERRASTSVAEEVILEMVVSAPAGEDPRNQPGVPLLDSPFPGASSLALDELVAEEMFNREDGQDYWIVRAYYSSDRRFVPLRVNRLIPELKIDYVTEALEVPAFRKSVRVAPNANGPGRRSVVEWQPAPLNIFITYLVIEKTVIVPPLTYQQVIDIRNQIGCLHRFPDGATDPLTGGPMEWKLDAAPISQVNQGRYRIAYRWVNDPGNGPFADDEGDVQGIIAPHFSRMPFHNYYVIPSQLNNPNELPPTFTAPRIIQRPQFPPNSAYRKPNGHANLPGSPIP